MNDCIRFLRFLQAIYLIFVYLRSQMKSVFYILLQLSGVATYFASLLRISRKSIG